MKRNILNLFCALSLTCGFASCTDYLDKTPDSTVNADEAFKNFTNFQGFVEEVYNCIPNKESNYWCCSFNWGEDEILNTGLGDSHETAHFDLGDYRYWYNDPQSFLHSDGLSSTSTDKFSHSLEHAWYCIRKCNLGLENLEKMTNCTQEEKNIIKGQLLFFRAWWHEELMEFYGGMPYVDTVLDGSQALTLPRLSFQECATKCAEDFRAAADLLPNDWDKTTIGKKTLGKNDLRITKVCALGYLGKVLLWAASPLNNLGAEVGASKNGDTYRYNVEFAAKAADALAEAISQVNSGSTPYALAEYKYDNIYDHVASEDSKTNFSDIFRTTGKGWKQPGSTEAILRAPYIGANGSNWNFTKNWGIKINEIVQHDALIHQPTANYVNYYGMANGLPLDDPESGFDPTHPFKGRDPRFYHDIVFDGFQYINTTIGKDDPDYQFKYVQMYTGSNLRSSSSQGCRTGYYCQKLVPHQANKYDGMYNWGGALQCDLPYMRLADIYLMYAEAGAAVQGANYKSNKCNLTAVDAINVLRDRVEAGHVADKYAANQQKFMDEVRRERAVELAFEGFRWNDLQRWLLLTEYPYNIKTSQEFKRVGNYDFTKKDPRDAEVTGWSEKTILTRDFSEKHYLLPLKQSDVYLYPEFGQNPGW
ncbi:RagB/SusD family nutrient uptake outer membrane protein [Prevotella copri]|uniref:RagB/SusD family nutrient uptake outer membrane protein n=1 Tax=Segatella copri TaxID=165179 RepID=UPI001C2CA71B|nr:RagB/SusD family nutrient uptake outer membrane protein [Segatella copri]MBU9906622.1 RagB/SusD family nutrient uptake outer membrane protein [Segatella copri]MBV3372045.1 RagB/SusD family nutrient uptake outer membrane protein [Segatella copri]